ncbi:MAG: hypothetical protein NWS37_02920 [Flavobacteriaceae bacterium]|jgi:hypothetical protein|nr:hypothetical protein [Flavobacteriaceae bacterium]
MKNLKYLFLVLSLNIFFGCEFFSETSSDESEEITTEDSDITLQEGLEDGKWNKDYAQKPQNEKKQITEADLKFESIFEKRSLFLKKGEKLKEAFYGLSGDSIRIEFLSDSPVLSLSIIEERSGRPVKIFKKQNKIDFIYDVYFDNTFSINADFVRESYVNIKISRKSASVENYYNQFEITRDSIVVQNKTQRSLQGTTMGYEKAFNEPKKFIVSNSLSLSGESKVYAPIDVPANTKEFIYTLRISGKDQALSEDGQLFDNVSSSSKEIKVFGIPLWESSGSKSSLSREILNNLFPPQKDEDFSLNVFFFDKESEIKKFLNYTGEPDPKAFLYDINNSAISTQSRVGLIKKPRTGYSYIGLQTNSTWKNTYAWLDVVALSEKTFHYEIRYGMKKIN